MKSPTPSPETQIVRTDETRIVHPTKISVTATHDERKAALEWVNNELAELEAEFDDQRREGYPVGNLPSKREAILITIRAALSAGNGEGWKLIDENTPKNQLTEAPGVAELERQRLKSLEQAELDRLAAAVYYMLPVLNHCKRDGICGDPLQENEYYLEALVNCAQGHLKSAQGDGEKS